MDKSKLIKQIAGVSFVFLSLYILIWLWFYVDGFIYVGDGLMKKDWLSFLSGFLSFLGTVLVSTVVISQNRRFKKMESERLRLQNLPSLKFSKSNVYTEFEFITFEKLKKDTKDPRGKAELEKSPFSDSQEVICIANCPLIIWEKEILLLKGDENSLAVALKKDLNYRAIYKAENYGLGTAVNLSINVSSSDNKDKTTSYNYGGLHLKETEKVYFEMDIINLSKKEDRNLIIEFNFSDIYGNNYSQKCHFYMEINGTIFNFDITKKDEVPQLIKTLAIHKKWYLN